VEHAHRDDADDRYEGTGRWKRPARILLTSFAEATRPEEAGRGMTTLPDTFTILTWDVSSCLAERGRERVRGAAHGGTTGTMAKSAASSPLTRSTLHLEPGDTVASIYAIHPFLHVLTFRGSLRTLHLEGGEEVYALPPFLGPLGAEAEAGAEGNGVFMFYGLHRDARGRMWVNTRRGLGQVGPGLEGAAGAGDAVALTLPRGPSTQPTVAQVPASGAGG
jgi:hypothetical protein